jgi:hypothetical protein
MRIPQFANPASEVALFLDSEPAAVTEGEILEAHPQHGGDVLGVPVLVLLVARLAHSLTELPPRRGILARMTRQNERRLVCQVVRKRQNVIEVRNPELGVQIAHVFVLGQWFKEMRAASEEFRILAVPDLMILNGAVVPDRNPPRLFRYIERLLIVRKIIARVLTTRRGMDLV